VRIAVVIPALDEAESVEAAIASALAAADPEVEVLVADGGSRDATVSRALAAGARVLACPAGRAQQQEAGWRATQGEVVVFLHGDTQLPSGWAPALRTALLARSVAGGAFRLRFEPRNAALAVVEWGAHLRARWLGLPYGDQALFVRRTILDAIGGVPPVPLFEDLDLVCAMRRHGSLALLPLDALTSSRRYRQHGVVRTWCRHALALAAWRLGVDRDRLARGLHR
jgi:rSAM/selenodomain-associated transferase 2